MPEMRQARAQVAAAPEVKAEPKVELKTEPMDTLEGAGSVPMPIPHEVIAPVTASIAGKPSLRISLLTKHVQHCWDPSLMTAGLFWCRSHRQHPVLTPPASIADIGIKFRPARLKRLACRPNLWVISPAQSTCDHPTSCDHLMKLAWTDVAEAHLRPSMSACTGKPAAEDLHAHCKGLVNS